MLRDGAGNAARFSRVWVLVKLGCVRQVGGQFTQTVSRFLLCLAIYVVKVHLSPTSRQGLFYAKLEARMI